jgi:hypothetical protein
VRLAAKDGDRLAAYCDTRGIARALTGDIQGAIKDFEAAITSTSNVLNKKQKAQRQQWIDALRKGQQPFTPEVLKQLNLE